MTEIQKYYQIIGVDENVSDEELYQAYLAYRTKLQNDRFLEGEAGNEAARKLTELNNAYNEIKDYRKEHSSTEDRAQSFAKVDSFIKSGKINEAQAELDNFSERSAEWHYLQSVVFYKKNWVNESKKQLEIAMNMEPHNPKYAESYSKLKQKMEYADKQFRSGNASYGSPDVESQNYADRQMGGSACGGMLDCCTTWCCMNLLCNGCCR